MAKTKQPLYQLGQLIEFTRGNPEKEIKREHGTIFGVLTTLNEGYHYKLEDSTFVPEAYVVRSFNVASVATKQKTTKAKIRKRRTTTTTTTAPLTNHTANAEQTAST